MKSQIDSTPVSETAPALVSESVSAPSLLPSRPPLYSELERVELYYCQRLACMQAELDMVRNRLRSALVVHHTQLESLSFELMRDLKAIRNLGSSHSTSV